MITWELIWTIVFGVSLIAFASLVVVVSIGGFSDIRAMLRSIARDHNSDSHRNDDQRSP